MPRAKTKAKETTSRKRPAKRSRGRRTSKRFGFLSRAHSAVRSHLRGATDLPTFLASAGGLTLNGRKRIVEQALLLIEQNYVHLPLKESMHGVDPVQRLRLVKYQLDQSTQASMAGEYAFHREMLAIINSVR